MRRRNKRRSKSREKIFRYDHAENECQLGFTVWSDEAVEQFMQETARLAKAVLPPEKKQETIQVINVPDEDINDLISEASRISQKIVTEDPAKHAVNFLKKALAFFEKSIDIRGGEEYLNSIRIKDGVLSIGISNHIYHEERRLVGEEEQLKIEIEIVPMNSDIMNVISELSKKIPGIYVSKGNNFLNLLFEPKKIEQ